MKKFAIIAEYNPLHSGHQYHISETRRIASDIIVVMSGSFTQRGDFVVEGKYKRAEKAIAAGADMVVELPQVFASSPADKFALWGVKTAAVAGAEALSFGSESGNIEKLKETERLFEHEPEELKKVIREGLDAGLSLISARALGASALSAELTPNNTLGIEYLRAIRQTGEPIEPYTLKRQGNGYTSHALTGNHLSATAIRQAIYSGNEEAVMAYLPSMFDYNPLAPDNFSSMALYKLNTMTAEEIEKLFDVTEGLHNRIVKCLQDSADYETFIKTLKTKRYTMARLKRIVIYAMLNITKDVFARAMTTPPYLNVLAIRESKLNLLSEARTDYIVTKPSEAKYLPEKVNELYKLDCRADRLLCIINGVKPEVNAMRIVK